MTIIHFLLLSSLLVKLNLLVSICVLLMLSAAEQLEPHALRNSRSSLVTSNLVILGKLLFFMGQERDIYFFMYSDL